MTAVAAKHKYTYRSRAKFWVHLVLMIGSILMIFPFIWTILTSFKTQGEAIMIPPIFFPSHWNFDSYKEVLRTLPFDALYLNTLVLIFWRVICASVFSSMAGYAFAKIPFKGSKWLFGMILVAMMIPYQVTQVPLYILVVKQFKMSNTYAALILPGIVSSYNVFLAKQFFTSIPTPLLESAKLDGCSHPGIFVKIVMPLSKTVLAVMAINTFMSTWNTFFWPFLVTSKDSMFTIQVGLKTFKFANETLFAPMMAGATLSALPMFILFFALQKYFLEGVTIGAVKG